MMGTNEITIPPGSLILIVGLPGSGKSTFAWSHFPKDAIASTDDFRRMIANNPNSQIKAVSAQAFLLANVMARERLQRGRIAVIDAQNITEQNRAQFYETAREFCAKIIAIVLDVDAGTCAIEDSRRARTIGASTILRKRDTQRIAIQTISTHPDVYAVHVIRPEERDAVSIILPDIERRAWEHDQKELENADREYLLCNTGTGLRKRSVPEGMRQLPVKAGSMIFVEADSNRSVDAFLARTFFPHQVIDAEGIARKLAVKVEDKAVGDFMTRITRDRAWHTLTTVIRYPKGFPHIDRIRRGRGGLFEIESKLGVPIPSVRIAFTDDSPQAGFQGFQIPWSEVSTSAIRVTGTFTDAGPMAIVGDVQGCYTALRTIAMNIRKENRERRKKGLAKRTLILVGDLGDRGPFDAKAVMYGIALQRRGLAESVLSNHDQNLYEILSGGSKGSQETKRTAAELQARLKPRSIKKIIETIRNLPTARIWNDIAVVHASLRRIPRPYEHTRDTEYAESEFRARIYGIPSGQAFEGRKEVWTLPFVVAHDPEILIVGGHTHDPKVVLNESAGSIGVDGGVEVNGQLHTLLYPEMNIAVTEEPSVRDLYATLRGHALPKEGRELLEFVEYARLQGYVELNHGSGEYEDLTIVNYSGVTELSNAWAQYPVLRHFRAFIMDREGRIVARPFQKTHKAGEEIPLAKLDMKPERLWTKENGTMIVLYFWNGCWRTATKNSFTNVYTKEADAILGRRDLDHLNHAYTFVFEIILPDDPHIVDYKGVKELVLLNAIHTASGTLTNWEEVARWAENLGIRTPKEDRNLRHLLQLTIADIWRYAQTPAAAGIEGLMALYRDETGNPVFVKVKTRDYTDKKLIRDRLDWNTIIEKFDPMTMDLPQVAKEELLGFSWGSPVVQNALTARLAWMREQYMVAVQEVEEKTRDLVSEARQLFDAAIARGLTAPKATEETMRTIAPKVKAFIERSQSASTQSEMNALMPFVKILATAGSKPEVALAGYAKKRITEAVQGEIRKRGRAAFWIIPT